MSIIHRIYFSIYYLYLLSKIGSLMVLGGTEPWGSLK